MNDKDILISKMLQEGKSYTDIQAELGVSPSRIAVVKKINAKVLSSVLPVLLDTTTPPASIPIPDAPPTTTTPIFEDALFELLEIEDELIAEELKNVHTTSTSTYTPISKPKKPMVKECFICNKILTKGMSISVGKVKDGCYYFCSEKHYEKQLKICRSHGVKMKNLSQKEFDKLTDAEKE